MSFLNANSLYSPNCNSPRIREKFSFSFSFYKLPYFHGACNYLTLSSKKEASGARQIMKLDKRNESADNYPSISIVVTLYIHFILDLKSKFSSRVDKSFSTSFFLINHLRWATDCGP